MSWEAAGRQGVQALLIAAGELCSHGSFPLETLALQAGKISAGGRRQGRAGIPEILELLESRKGTRLRILPWLLEALRGDWGGGTVNEKLSHKLLQLPRDARGPNQSSSLSVGFFICENGATFYRSFPSASWRSKEQESRVRAGSCL